MFFEYTISLSTNYCTVSHKIWIRAMFDWYLNISSSKQMIIINSIKLLIHFRYSNNFVKFKPVNQKCWSMVLNAIWSFTSIHNCRQGIYKLTGLLKLTYIFGVLWEMHAGLHAMFILAFAHYCPFSNKRAKFDDL